MKQQGKDPAGTAELELTGLDEAAAVWSECLQEAGDDARVRGAFESWRNRDPAHAAAFERIQRAKSLVASVADAPEILALRLETLTRVAELQRRSRPQPRRYRRAWIGGALAAGLVLGVSAAALYWPQMPRALYESAVALLTGNVYTTGVGERLTVALDDGTIVTLDTGSRMSVHYRDGIRGITLDHGQAMFEVAHDAVHPFIVAVGDHSVTALGTQFDVRLIDQELEVTLVEGRVAVSKEEMSGRVSSDTTDATASPVSKASRRVTGQVLVAELSPGQQFVEVASAAPIVRNIDIHQAISWSSGQLIFENDRLADVVVEMNRYTRRHVVLGDARLSDLRVSGAFATGKTKIFVDALTTYFPITVARQDDDTVVVAKRQ